MDHAPCNQVPNDALGRLLALAIWAQERHEGFTAAEVRAAFPEWYGPGAGSEAAVERKWTRDKAHLAALGLRFLHPEENSYRVDWSSWADRPSLTREELRDLAAAVRALPAAAPKDPSVHHLELALRKLVLTVPRLGGALLHRAAAAGPDLGLPPPPPALSRLLSKTWVLLQAALGAGDDALDPGSALALSAAATARELARMEVTLLRLRVPLDGRGWLPVLLEDGWLWVYSAELRLRPLAFTDREAEAFARAVDATRLGAGAARMAARALRWMAPRWAPAREPELPMAA